MLWTGDGTPPSGESIEAHAFELGFSEAMDAARMTNVTATLTPEGGSAVNLSVTLGPDGRSAELTGCTIEAGSNYALHFEGMRDTSGNALQPEDRMLNVADPESFEVIADTAAPVLLAVMDGNDGIYLLFDEAVVGSGDLTAAVTLTRQGVEVDGVTSRVDAKVLKWTPTEATTWLLGAQYGLAGIDVEDLAGNAATVSSMAFAHLAGDEGQLLVARQAPTDSYPMAASAYGVTTLFQGRTWHSDLGMYYYRARWYLPDGGVFGERDPLGYGDSGDLYQILAHDAVNMRDPMGKDTWAIYQSHQEILTLVNVQNRRLGMVSADLPRLYPQGYPKIRQTRILISYSTYSGKLTKAAIEEVDIVRDWQYREKNPPWISHERETGVLNWDSDYDPWLAYSRMDEGGRLINRIISGWLNKKLNKKSRFRTTGPVAVPGDFLVGAGKLFSNVVMAVSLLGEVSAAAQWVGRVVGWGSNAYSWLSSDDFLVSVETVGLPVNMAVLPGEMPKLEKASFWSAGYPMVACH